MASMAAVRSDLAAFIAPQIPLILGAKRQHIA
jgi:hypothetical protein